MAPAADPRKTYYPALERQRELLTRVHGAVDSVGASRQRLEDRVSQLASTTRKLEEEARQALLQGREDAARLTLLRRHEAVEQRAGLERQRDAVRQEEERLVLLGHRLSADLDAFAVKQEVIAARYTAAAAHVRIGEAFGGLAGGDAGRGGRQKAEDDLEAMEARAWAIEELTRSGILQDPTAPWLRRSGVYSPLPSESGEAPETAAAVVEREIANLKRELGI